MKITLTNRKSKVVTAEDIAALHALRDAGVPKSVAKKLTGRSLTVIDFAYKAKDYEEYKKLSQEFWNRQKAKTEAVKKVEVPKEELAPREITVLSELQRQNKLLSELNENVKTLGNFVVKAYNESKLKKNKFLNVL